MDTLDRNPIMRAGQRLTYEDLRDEARKAVAAYEGTQTELAEHLGVNKSSISRAIREPGAHLASLQRRILTAVYPEYEVEEQVTFQVRRAEPEK